MQQLLSDSFFSSHLILVRIRLMRKLRYLVTFWTNCNLYLMIVPDGKIIQFNSSHRSISFNRLFLSWSWGAGANPSWHWTKGGVHGRWTSCRFITGLTRKQPFTLIFTHQLTCMSLDCGKKLQRTHADTGRNMQTPCQLEGYEQIDTAPPCHLSHNIIL